MNSATLSVLLCILLAPALARAAEAEDETRLRSPLNLSLPRDALVESWTPPAGNAVNLPGLGEHPRPMPRPDQTSPGMGGRSDLPYGAGYDARQQGGARGGGGGRGRGR